jgi:predicted metal-dependent peptidase
LLHEAHHLVREHHDRAEKKGITTEDQQYLFNLCCDAAINDDLVDEGVPLPEPVLPSDLGQPSGGLEEAYFDRLRSSDAVMQARCGSGAGGVPQTIELSEHAAPAIDIVDATTIRDAVRSAVRATFPRGNDSGGLRRWASGLGEPEVPWQVTLRRLMLDVVRARPGVRRATWVRPARRSDPHEVFLQSGVIHETTRIAVVIDTSASMDTRLLNAAATELRGLLRATRGVTVTVVACDAAAGVPQAMRRFETLALEGGGGTDLRVGIDAAASFTPRPSLIVVLTDGETPWPSEAPRGTHLLAVVLGKWVPLPDGRGISAVRIVP